MRAAVGGVKAGVAGVKTRVFIVPLRGQGVVRVVRMIKWWYYSTRVSAVAWTGLVSGDGLRRWKCCSRATMAKGVCAEPDFKERGWRSDLNKGEKVMMMGIGEEGAAWSFPRDTSHA